MYGPKFSGVYHNICEVKFCLTVECDLAWSVFLECNLYTDQPESFNMRAPAWWLATHVVKSLYVAIVCWKQGQTVKNVKANQQELHVYHNLFGLNNWSRHM